MLEKLINRSTDLQRLQNEGYEMELRGNYLLLHSIPYVNNRAEVAFGSLVTNLTLNADKTQRPSDHQVWFTGEHPCDQNGNIIKAISHTSTTQTLYDGIVVKHHFSCKPQGGYKDYYEKMTRYAEIISIPAIAIDHLLTPRTYKPIQPTNEASPFQYIDSASSRAGISSLSDKISMNKVAIIGLGGTGSYVLDLIAKTPIQEIHLFDGDQFLQHNAFRAPGAASIESLSKKLYKVTYYHEIYSRMRRAIFPHTGYLDEENIDQLADFDFIFLCVDKAAVRKLVSDFLHEKKIPFIDVGMELEFIDEQQCLIGTCRSTLVTPNKSNHYPRHVSLTECLPDDLYDSNVQVAELNALNATMAVIKWKKYCGFYQDHYMEYQSTYTINTHQLSRDEITGPVES